MFSLSRQLILLSMFLQACGLRPTIPGKSSALPAYQTLTAGLYHLAFMQAGSREANVRVILIHGTPGTAEGWQNYLLAPPTDVEVVAMDRVGFGKSSQLESAISVLDQARTIEPLLSQFKKNIIVGHSLGAPIALAVAELFPTRVSGVITLAGSADPMLEQPRWYNWLASTWILQVFLPHGWKYSNKEIYKLAEGLEEIALALSNIRAPVFVVQGQRDTLVMPTNAEFLKSKLNGSAQVNVTMLPEANHFLPWQEEAVVRDIIGEAVSYARTSN